jgi:hypothetical protein
MRYIKEYQRWWCDAEKKYAPKRVKNPCPTCGKELSYVRTYDRWYCPFEKKYAPKAYQTSAAVERIATPSETAPPALRAKLAAATAAVETPAEAIAVREVHAHRAPGIAIILAVVGFIVLILNLLLLGPNSILTSLNAGIVIGDPTTTNLVSGVLQLIGLALAMGGTVLGFSSLRSRSE